MNNPAVFLQGDKSLFASPQDTINWPGNLPPLSDQVKQTYIPLSGVQPLYGDTVDTGYRPGDALPTAVQQPEGYIIHFPDVQKTIEDHRYATIIDISQAVSSTVSGQIIDKPNGRRNFLLIRNASATANIYIGFGKAATTLSTLLLSPGQIATFDSVVPQDDVFAIADAVSAIICYAYSNI
jgi:hypothetical protein